MDHIQELLEILKKEEFTAFEDFPDIDLYMDQVITYLSRESIPLKSQEKLTSAMINNYIKDGIMPRTSGKKYSREHLVYLIIISKLKQVLSVKDIGLLLSKDIANQKIEEYYDSFLTLSQTVRERLVEDVERHQSETLSAVIMDLAMVSYYYKAVCQFLLDKIAEEERPQKDKKK